MKVSRLPFDLVIVGLLSAGTAVGSLTVANPSFELPTFADAAFGQFSITAAQQGGDGWTFTDASGIYNPPANDFVGAGGSGTPAGADGSQVGFSVQRYPLFQTLAGTDQTAGNADDPLLTARTTYRLTLDIGQRLPGNQYGGVYGGYVVELLAGVGAGTTVIAQEIDAITPTPGTFVERTITVDSATLSPTLYGQPLTIRIGGTLNAGNAATDFDNVRLDANVTAIWSNAIDGNWDDATKWSSNPAIPNNPTLSGATYDALINATGAAYVVTLGTNIALEDFTLNSANAILRHIAGNFSVTSSAALMAGTHFLKGGSITGGTINVTGGTLAFGDATPSGNRLAGVTINGDLAVQDTSFGFVRIGTGTTLNGTARLQAPSGATIAFEGTQLFGNGTISFESGATPAYVEMQSAGTLTIGAPAAIRGGEGRVGGSFYFGAPMTLVNQGLISAEVNGRTIRLTPSNGLSNTGTMQAINGGILAIEPTMPWSNNGTISVNNATVNLGGTFDATAGIGTWSNTNGTVNITGTLNNAASTLTLNNATGSWTLSGGTFQGGALNFADGKTLLIGAQNGNLLTGVTINGDVAFNTTGAHTRIAGGTTFTNAHLAATDASLGFAPGQTLTGSIVFEGAAGGIRAVEMDGNAGAFTIAPSGAIRTETGFGANAQIGPAYWFSGAMSLTNRGLISSQTSGQTLAVRPDTLTSTGTMQAIDGGILAIEPAMPWSNAGTISVNNATVNLGGTFDVTGGVGTWSNSGGSVNIVGTINNTASTLTLNNATGSWLLKGGTLQGGSLAFADGKTLLIGAQNANLLAGVTINGDLALNTTSAHTRIGGGTTFTSAHLSASDSSLGFAPGQILAGSIIFDGGTSGIRAIEMDGNAGAFTVGPTGVIRTEAGFGGSAQIGPAYWFSGAMTLANQGLISSEIAGKTVTIRAASFTNSGTLQAINDGVLSVPGGYTQTAGVTRVSGTLTAQTGAVNDMIQLTGGALEGDGTIVAHVAASGVIDPTSGPGGLAINGDLSLGANAELRFTIGGTAQGTQYDFLSEAGTVPLTLDGTLVLTLADGFTPAPGDTFTILMSNANLAGAFDNVAPGMRLMTSDGTSSFQVNYGAGSPNIALSNFIIPEPDNALLFVVGTVFLAVQRRRHRVQLTDASLQPRPALLPSRL